MTHPKMRNERILIIPSFYSEVLGNQRDIQVYLPPEYATEPDQRFPVLYMHDGQGIFAPTFVWR